MLLPVLERFLHPIALYLTKLNQWGFYREALIQLCREGEWMSLGRCNMVVKLKSELANQISRPDLGLGSWRLGSFLTHDLELKRGPKIK